MKVIRRVDFSLKENTCPENEQLSVQCNHSLLVRVYGVFEEFCDENCGSFQGNGLTSTLLRRCHCSVLYDGRFSENQVAFSARDQLFLFT